MRTLARFLGSNIDRGIFIKIPLGDCTGVNKIIIDWKVPIGLKILWAVAFFYGCIVLLFAYGDKKQMALLATAFFCLFILSAFIFNQTPKTTEIDIDGDIVVTYCHVGVGGARTKIYSLHSFQSVRSILTRGRNTVNVLELVSKNSRESLKIAIFEPDTTDNGFFSSPRCIEAKKATQLRKEISEKFSLGDEGFLGFEFFSLKEIAL